MLVPSFTFSGTINAIVQSNLKPVCCDMDESLILGINKFSIDSSHIKMVIAVGAHGNLPDIEKLGKWADDIGLVFIIAPEDVK